MKDIDLEIYDVRKSSHVYKIASGRKKIVWNLKNFIPKKRKKNSQRYITETIVNKKCFFIGFNAADGKKNVNKNYFFNSKT